MNRGVGLGWTVGPGLKFDNIDGLGQDRAVFFLNLFWGLILKCFFS